jgi:hypothetical protein
MSVTYTASLPVSEDTVVFVSTLLHAERRRLGTRAGTRSLGCFRQAILVLRWLLDGTRITQLAIDNQVSRSTGYAYLHEGLTVIAGQAPGLSSVLLAAKMAGYAHINIDGTLIETDRSRTRARPSGWISGGRESTTTTAVTCRSSPLRTAGRSGPQPCVPAANMTPPPCAATTSCRC